MKSNFAFALLVTVSLTAVQVSRAGEPLTTAPATHENEQLFRANELSLDVFGTVSVNQYTLNHISGQRVRDDGSTGLGVGANYFFTRYLGVGGDVYSENVTGSFIDNASGNLIVRIPLDEIHLAPYVYAGGGYQFDSADRAFAQGGLGLEVRFTKNIGLFVDGRYIMLDGAQNFGMARTGLRFSF